MKKARSLSLTDKAVRAMHDAVAKVVETHRRDGRPLAVWRDGKAVWLPVSSTGAIQESRARPLPEKPGDGFTTFEELHKDSERVFAYDWYRRKPITVDDLEAAN